MPEKDHPLIFGLNANADLTFRLKESTEMIAVLIETQPKDAGGGSGLSREDQVKLLLETDLIKGLPVDFNLNEVEDRLKTMGGPRGLSEKGKGIPLNVFLFQEIQRLQLTLTIVRTNMTDMVQAIEGTVVMTEVLVECINNVFDFRVPQQWYLDPTGAEIAWIMPSLSGWLKGLNDRHHQLTNWIFKERPPSFWLTGFFNGQGFLTAMKQEVTRQNKANGWSLDQVDIKTEPIKDRVTDNPESGRLDGKSLTAKSEGVLIHGLFLEGCQWNYSEQRLEEQTQKDIYYLFPIMWATAVSTAVDPNARGPAKKQDQAAIEKTQYLCPVYKYPKRNDKYLVFRCYLKADAPSGNMNLSRGVTPPMNWKLKGVALLCQKE